MIGLLLHGLRHLWRRLRRAPDYVAFTIEEAYEELPPAGLNPLQRKLFPTKLTLRELGERMRTAAADPRVSGIVLHLRDVPMPISHQQTLRELVAEAREAGKRVVAWSPAYGGGSYHVACACDEILLQRGGGIAPLGSRMTFLFVADALARAGLEADFVQISPYKSAADMLTRSEMSEESRSQANWLADSLFDQFLRAIAAGRQWDAGRARSLVDASPYIDVQALEAGAVDAICAEESLPERLRGQRGPARIEPWDRARKRLLPPPRRRRGKYVALLRIEGDIVDGRSRRPPFQPPVGIPLLGRRSGDLTVVQEARKVARDRRAAAVVLWVESGGGSANSSEAMSAALETIAARKPLVAAMGWAAGSGGYYVTTPARWVVAQPGTLTGSIGVLGGKIVNAKMLEKLDVNREFVTRGDRSLFLDSSRRFTDEEREILWRSINRTYDVFCERVSAAREKSRDDVDAIGGGRVWTGEQALEHGLVDELGGLERAIAKARELAGLHPRAAVREPRVGKRELAPAVQKGAGAIGALEYVIEGLRTLDGAKPLCLMPIVPG